MSAAATATKKRRKNFILAALAMSCLCKRRLVDAVCPFANRFYTLQKADVAYSNRNYIATKFCSTMQLQYYMPYNGIAKSHAR